MAWHTFWNIFRNISILLGASVRELLLLYIRVLEMIRDEETQKYRRNFQTQYQPPQIDHTSVPLAHTVPGSLNDRMGHVLTVLYWTFFLILKKERKEKRKNSFRAGGVINWQIKSQGIKRKEHLFFCVCVPWRARISIRRERARAPQWRWPKIPRQVSDAAKKTSSYFAYERKERKKNKKAPTPIR